MIGLKRTIIGDIPSDWELKPFGEICSPSKSRINPLKNVDSYRCVELEHLSQETGRLLGYVDIKGLKSQKTLFQKGDILFGKLRPYLKKYLYAEFRGACSTEIWVLQSEKEINSRWLFYLTQSHRIIEAANLSTGTKMPRAEWNTMKNTIVPFPPTKTEQTNIAAALSDMDALIISLEQLILKRQNIKQGAMQELLKPKDGWEVKKLGEVTDCLDYLRVTLNDNERAGIKGDIPYCGANGVVDYVNDYVIDDDIILVAEDGGYFDEYKTRPIAYKMNGKCWVNNHAHILKAKKGSNQDFIFYSLVHKNILDYINGGTRAKLNKGELVEITINIPPSSNEQTTRANFLSDMDEEISALQNKLVKFKLIKQGMMQNLLTGKIRLL